MARGGGGRKECGGDQGKDPPDAHHLLPELICRSQGGAPPPGSQPGHGDGEGMGEGADRVGSLGVARVKGTKERQSPDNSHHF